MSVRNRVESLAPLPLVTILLVIATLATARPLLKTALLILTVLTLTLLIGAAAGVRPLLRRLRATRGAQWITAPWLLLAVVGIAGFIAMVATRPTLQVTYPASAFTTAPGIAEQRGFYPPETDAAGNRYVWTRDRGTLVFDFLPRKPITLALALRSAAVAGGPDTPVTVEINGQPVGRLRPDPANPQFQTFTLRVTPNDWGGERTELRLSTQTFVPGRSDTRTLGTMVESVAVDTTEAWSGVARRLALLGAIPACALLAAGFLLWSRRSGAPLAGYGALAFCALGAGGAALLAALVTRAGVIQRDTYYVWLLTLGLFIVTFSVALLALPLGAWGSASALARGWRRIAASRLGGLAGRIGARVQAARAPLPEEPEPQRRALARDLVLLFALAFGVRLLWVVLVPPWQAPDEPDHYSYVTQLVEQGRMPQTTAPGYPAYSEEVTASWGYTLIGAISSLGGNAPPPLAQLPVAYDYTTARAYEAPGAARRSGAAGRASPHPPLYYLIGAAPYALVRDAPILTRLYAVRSASAALGALSSVFAYLLAFELRRSRRWGWALGCAMALLPMYVFITATVNNDVGMDAAAAALLWLTVRVSKQATLSPRLAVAVGVAAGAALLMKVTVYAIVLVAGVVVLVKSVQAYRASRQHPARHAAAFGAFAASAAVLYLPWLVLLYRSTDQIKLISIPLAPLFRWLTGATTVAAGGPDRPPLAQFALRFPIGDYLRSQQERGWLYFDNLFIKDVWGMFGWLDVPLAEPVYTAIRVFVAIGGIGVALQCARQARWRRFSLLLAGIVLVQVFFLFVVIDWYGAYANSGQEFGLQGRYFFPVLAPALYLLLSGWEYLAGENGIALRLVPLAMALLLVVAVGTVIARYYGVVFG